MKKTNKKTLTRWGQAIFIAFISATSVYAQDSLAVEPELTITKQPAAISIAEKDQAVTLSVTMAKGENSISYQWFQSDNAETQNGTPIKGATESSYDTEAFTEKGIRYYYCVASVGKESVTSSVAAVAYTGLPVLYVNTPKGVEITSKEEWTKKATLTLANTGNPKWDFKNDTTSIRGRGNSTWLADKKPYALKLNKKNGIMGMPKHKRWVLIANYYDNSFLKNHMAFYLSETLDMDYTVRGKFVDLVFNGVYRGLYWLGEAIKPDENRVNIDDGSEEMTADDDKDFLIEMDNHFDEIVKFWSPIRNMPYMVKNDDYMLNEEEDAISNDGQARLDRFHAKIEKLEKLLYPNFAEGTSIENRPAPDESYTKIIDVESWAKFWLINEIMDNTELREPKSAYFTYDNKNDLFKAGPVWDFDAGASTDDAPVQLDTTIYFDALFKSPLFIAATEKVWNEYKEKIKIDSVITAMRNVLDVAAKVDSLRWGIHLDISNVERSNYGAYVDFLKTSLNNKIATVGTYVNDLPKKQAVSPTLALSTEIFEYNGAENKPAVLITDEDNKLVEGEDYILTYSNNIDAGTAKVRFDAIGNYAGWQEKTFVITPKPAKLTALNASKMYGEKDPQLNYSVDELASRNGIQDVLSGVELTREKGEELGNYTIMVTVDAEANPNYVLSTDNGEFSIVPDSTEIIVSVKGHVDTIEYNGNKHSVQGFDMTSSKEAYSIDFVTYAGDSLVTATFANTHTMGLIADDFANTNPNYSNVVFDITDGNLVITPKPVTLTVKNASKTYGAEDPEFSFSVEGLVTADSVQDRLNDVELSREKGEDAAKYVITASIEADANPDYIVTVNDGVFTINPDTTKIIVSIKGHSDSLVYNGNKQSVHGFDIVSSNTAYAIDFVGYAGDSLAAGTDAKTYAMGLKAENFANTNHNYSNVVFDITDGNLVITPKPVTLTVKSASKTYGAKDPEFTYTVEGLVTVDSVQDQLSSVVLSRQEGENVGKYAITPSVAADSNPNYIVSTTDGIFTIMPDSSEIIITIKGHTDTVEYDKQKHVVHGFDMVSSSTAYSIDFVGYTGDSLVAGTDVKTYPMGLKAEDFKNKSENYSNVIFKVTDGNLTIVKNETTKAILASHVPASLLKVSAADRRIQVSTTMAGKPYSVFDMQGTIVRTGRVEASSFEISVSRAGVYMVRIGSLTQRISVK